MKAMLLAAGRGERLRPVTDRIAKPLVKVGGKPLIEYHIEALARANIVDLVINTSWLAEQIVDTLGDGSRYGVTIQYSHEPQALETAGGIVNALPLLGDRPFLVVSSDVWSDIDYSTITLPRGADMHLLMVSNPPHHPHGDFEIDNGKLRQPRPDGDEALTYSGIGLFQPKLFGDLPPGIRALRPVMLETIERRTASAEFHNGIWFDAGTAERISQIESHLSGIRPGAPASDHRRR